MLLDRFAVLDEEQPNELLANGYAAGRTDARQDRSALPRYGSYQPMIASVRETIVFLSRDNIRRGERGVTIQ